MPDPTPQAMPTATPEAILTVDLEDWYHNNFETAGPPASKAPPSHVVEHTHILLKIFRRHCVCATFFTLGAVAREHPELLRTIVREGHEIACHGDAHLLVSELDPDSFRDDLRRANDAIYRACGKTPRGFRAPSWSISPPRWQTGEAAMWPLQILAEEGFTYDASLFPFKTFLYGVRGAPTAPHRVVLPNGASIHELPAAVVDLFGRRLPFGGGFYLRLLPLSVTRWLGRRFIKSQASPFMFYIHPREISAIQPRLELGLRDRFIHYYNLRQNRAKLDRLLGQFQFCNVEELVRRRGSEFPPLHALN